MRFQGTGNPRRLGIRALYRHAEHFRNLFCGDVAGAQQHRAHPLLDARQVDDRRLDPDLARTTFDHGHAGGDPFRKLAADMRRQRR